MSPAAKRATQLLERVLARLESAEDREGQAEMVRHVADAIATRESVIVQAGTGTGKTLGYLIPVLAAGQTAVVATYTKALQDQLASTDLPLLHDVCAGDKDLAFTWAVLKGRNNYVCRQRVADVEGGTEQLDLEGTSGDMQHEIRALVEWAAGTSSGDVSDVPFAVSDSTWRKLSVSSDECPGASKCRFGDTCFTETARQRAAESNVVVVNFTLYGLDLQQDREFLPEHDVVVFDEVHELEDVVSDTASVVVTPRWLSNVAETARQALKTQKVANALAKTASELDEVLLRHVGTRFRDSLPGDVESSLTTALAQIELLSDQVSQRGDETPEVLRAESTLTRAKKDIERVLAANSDTVCFVTDQRGSARLTAAPLRIDGVLAPVWADNVAILTSATIPPGLPQRLGLAKTDDDIVRVKSPFDYKRRSLLYLAGDLPAPNEALRAEKVHERIQELIAMSNGSALVLFTSWNALNEAVSALRGNLGSEIRLYAQDDMPKKMLLEEFRSDVHSCLFATRGYFQGVDVPGDALRLVIIDKVPFPALQDPLLDARREHAGKDSFLVVDIPIAAASLAQAAGRLIRTATDHGVVAILDPRLTRKRYKPLVLHGVEHMPETTSLTEVEEFFLKRRDESDSPSRDW